MTSTLEQVPGPSGPPAVLQGVLAALRGTVLEIGPGAGVNLPWFGSDVRWIGVEPDPVARDLAVRRAARLGRTIDLVAGPVENLDLPRGSVDAVVGTYVLCSVEEPRRAVAQVRRLLRPGGVYVFAEHVAAPRGTWTRRGQHLAALTAVRAGACRPNRDTEVVLRGAGFAEVTVRHDMRPGPFGTRTPLIAGSAVNPFDTHEEN